MDLTQFVFASLLRPILLVATALIGGSSLGAELNVRIDQLIAEKLDGKPASLSDDATFFRRLNLDFVGCIPSTDESRRFLLDTSPQKRRAAIDRLLDDPRYVDRMTNLFHVMLMESRGDDDHWERFLRQCFQENRPWDKMVRQILLPNREDETLRGAAYFYTRRLEKVGQNPTDYPGLTRDVGRLFLGVDLQCAECHDHLFIDDYSQRDFQGLFAVYQNVTIRKENFPAVNERSMTEKLQFASVLEDLTGTTGPRVPFGKEFEIPDPPEDDSAAKKRKKKPDPNDPPDFSALKLIAEELPQADNRLFRQNIANRLWFAMMGRGLVEPLDQFHSANQATHPELLELLADELANHDFDIKWFLREIALSETWQRGSQFDDPEDVPPRESYRLAAQRRLTADQLFFSTLRATGNLERLALQEDEPPGEDFKDLRSKFLKAFASEPKEPAIKYTPAVKQALFLLNDDALLGLFRPSSGNLMDVLSRLPDDKVGDELFLSIYSRLPSDAERQHVSDFLHGEREHRDRRLSQLAWAMITSIEFCVNH